MRSGAGCPVSHGRPPAARTASTVRTASTEAPASCTRTPQAPACAASTVVASVASSRRSAGRTAPSASASSRPRKVLREAPTSTGRPRPISRSSPASRAQLCSARLAKPSPGSSTSCSGATPAATTSSTRAMSSAHTSVTTSPYWAAAYISRLCPRQCISTHGTPASATSSAMFLSASPPLTSLTRVAPALDGRLGHLGARGVDAGPHAGGGELADHREHPPALLVGVDPVGAGPGRLAADVDVVGARGVHLQPVGDRGGRVGEAAAVGEGVRGDVEDAHHHAAPRPRQRDAHSASAEDEAHRLAPGRGVVAEDAADGGGHRGRPGLADAAHRHAQVLGLDDHEHAARLEDVVECVGDLAGHPLLHLRAPGVDVDQPGQLRQPGDPAVLARDVADVRGAVEGHQVVLAGRVHRDVLDQHELVVVLVERGRQHVERVLPEPAEGLGVGAGDPAGGVLQPGPVGVLPHRDQQLAHRRGGSRLVDPPGPRRTGRCGPPTALIAGPELRRRRRGASPAG